MRWEELLCTERLGRKPPKQNDGRSPFLSDHDKIIFSQAFRRLARKTQVHPLASNDHVHNRMTHSLEVACIGRSLAIRVGEQLQEKQHLPEGISSSDLGDIVQSTCLAHDIGNPPFGHTGEDAIGKWFKKHSHSYLSELNERERMDLSTFEGNAQGLRILTASASKAESGILSLTYATLSSFIKYPWFSDTEITKTKNKYGIFSSESGSFNEIAEKTGLIEKQPNLFSRHPLVYIMEAADDICYGLLDLEDGIEMGLVSWEQVFHIYTPLLSLEQVAEMNRKNKGVEDHKKLRHFRGKIIEAYISDCVEAFVSKESDLLSGDVQGDLISLCSNKVSSSIQQAKELARDRIFIHPRKVELEIGAYEIIYKILDKVIPAIIEYYQYGKAKEKENDMIIRLVGAYNLDGASSFYEALMVGVDFVSGMTDNYASYLSNRFTGLSYSE